MLRFPWRPRRRGRPAARLSTLEQRSGAGTWQGKGLVSSRQGAGRHPQGRRCTPQGRAWYTSTQILRSGAPANRRACLSSAEEWPWRQQYRRPTPTPQESPGPRIGGELIVDALIKSGVRHAFGIAGVHNLPVYDALPSGAITKLRHPPRAGRGAFMADGYARVSGRPAWPWSPPAPA